MALIELEDAGSGVFRFHTGVSSLKATAAFNPAFVTAIRLRGNTCDIEYAGGFFILAERYETVAEVLRRAGSPEAARSLS